MSLICTRSCNVRKGAFDSVMNDQGNCFSLLLDLYIVIRQSYLYRLDERLFFSLSPLKSLGRSLESGRLSSGMGHPFQVESSIVTLFYINTLKCMLTVMFSLMWICLFLFLFFVINLVHVRWAGLFLTMILYYYFYDYFFKNLHNKRHLNL